MISIFSLAFRAFTTFQFWRSELLSSLFSVLAFRAITIFSLAFRAFITSQFWRSEPSSLLSFGIHSHHYFQFGVQSLHHYFQFWRSEPSSLLSFGVQSHHRFSVSAFRAITIFSLAFRVVITSQSAFRAIDISSLSVRSHHHSSVSTFRAITISRFDGQIHRHSQFWRSEPFFILIQTFDATIFL